MKININYYQGTNFEFIMLGHERIKYLILNIHFKQLIQLCNNLYLPCFVMENVKSNMVKESII